jgi:hypothetical protein
MLSVPGNIPGKVIFDHGVRENRTRRDILETGPRASNVWRAAAFKQH